MVPQRGHPVGYCKLKTINIFPNGDRKKKLCEHLDYLHRGKHSINAYRKLTLTGLYLNFEHNQSFCNK